MSIRYLYKLHYFLFTGIAISSICACSPEIKTPSSMQAPGAIGSATTINNPLGINSQFPNGSGTPTNFPNANAQSELLSDTTLQNGPNSQGTSTEIEGGLSSGMVTSGQSAEKELAAAGSTDTQSNTSVRTSVDCNESLPCVGLLDAGALTISLLTMAYSTEQEELTVIYSVESTRDTLLYWEKPGDSLPDELLLTARVIDGNQLPDVASSSTLLAGSITTVEESYRVSLEASTTLVDYRLTIDEAGRLLAVFFNQVPVNHTNANEASDLAQDCQLQLPCRWLSEDKLTTVTLVLAERIFESNELIIVYYVETSSLLNVVVGQQSIAIDNTGKEIASNLHTLNDSSFTDTVEQTLQAGSSNRGIVDLSPQLAAEAQNLEHLMLDIVIKGDRPIYSHVPCN